MSTTPNDGDRYELVITGEAEVVRGESQQEDEESER